MNLDETRGRDPRRADRRWSKGRKEGTRSLVRLSRFDSLRDCIRRVHEGAIGRSRRSAQRRDSHARHRHSSARLESIGDAFGYVSESRLRIFRAFAERRRARPIFAADTARTVSLMIDRRQSARRQPVLLSLARDLSFEAISKGWLSIRAQHRAGALSVRGTSRQEFACGGRASSRAGSTERRFLRPGLALPEEGNGSDRHA